jgi:hypothetical protein
LTTPPSYRKETTVDFIVLWDDHKSHFEKCQFAWEVYGFKQFISAVRYFRRKEEKSRTLTGNWLAALPGKGLNESETGQQDDHDVDQPCIVNAPENDDTGTKTEELQVAEKSLQSNDNVHSLLLPELRVSAATMGSRVHHNTPPKRLLSSRKDNDCDWGTK